MGQHIFFLKCQNDGFIHLSAHCELEKSAELHRKGEEGLLLLKVHTNDLPGLKWEWSKSRGNCFAHIYGTLNTSVVQGTWQLSVDKATNLHIFPQAFYDAANE